jgi:hypothetical protein
VMEFGILRWVSCEVHPKQRTDCGSGQLFPLGAQNFSSRQQPCLRPVQ